MTPGNDEIRFAYILCYDNGNARVFIVHLPFRCSLLISFISQNAPVSLARAD